MIHHLSCKAILQLCIAILIIREAICDPVAKPDELFLKGVNYFTRSAKLAGSNFGFNKQLFPCPDHLSRTRVYNNEENNVQSLFRKAYRPWYDNNRYEKSRYESQYRPTEQSSITQWNTILEQYYRRLSTISISSPSIKNVDTATVYSENVNKPLENNDLKNNYWTETVLSTETTTEFTTDTTETTTESDEILDRIAVPPNVVATLLG